MGLFLTRMCPHSPSLAGSCGPPEADWCVNVAGRGFSGCPADFHDPPINSSMMATDEPVRFLSIRERPPRSYVRLLVDGPRKAGKDWAAIGRLSLRNKCGPTKNASSVADMACLVWLFLYTRLSLPRQSVTYDSSIFLLPFVLFSVSISLRVFFFLLWPYIRFLSLFLVSKLQARNHQRGDSLALGRRMIETKLERRGRMSRKPVARLSRFFCSAAALQCRSRSCYTVRVRRTSFCLASFSPFFLCFCHPHCSKEGSVLVRELEPNLPRGDESEEGANTVEIIRTCLCLPTSCESFFPSFRLPASVCSVWCV